MVIFEHRSGAYIKYVSTGAQKSAICRPPWRISMSQQVPCVSNSTFDSASRAVEPDQTTNWNAWK